jgi:hypothetical protein
MYQSQSIGKSGAGSMRRMENKPVLGETKPRHIMKTPSAVNPYKV